jgi:iron(III) transport system permease protein
MNAWRAAYGLGLILFVAVPVLLPFGGPFEPATWRWSDDDIERLAFLGRNTAALTAGTIALSLPVGAALAALLFRTSFRIRRFCLFLLGLVLFVPQTVLLSGWQCLLGAGAGLWMSGLTPAIALHALWAVPWVAFIIGLGLMWIEPELEDEAAQSVGPWRVLLLVALPRAKTSILAAALFVCVQTAAESSITDILRVPTLADEVRLQFMLAQQEALARTLLLSLPGLIVTWMAVLALVAYLERRLPPMAPPARPPRGLDFGHGWMRLTMAGLILTLLMAPVAGLIWKLGLTGHPPQWDAGVAGHYLQAEAMVRSRDLGVSLATTLVTGGCIAILALGGCWLARESRWFRWLLFSVLTWAWVLPGPVVGIGLHEAIMKLVELSPHGAVATLLYRGPSPLPVMWVQAIRVLPVAVVFLWPVVRMIPREWFEEARLGGAGALGELLHIVAPMTWPETVVTALAASALCLGEVAASGRVDTPGWQPYALMLLDRMHYGVENTLAALNLLLLCSLAILAALFAAASRLSRSVAMPLRAASRPPAS